MALGAEALSEQELLCCILGRGIAGESVLVTAVRLLGTFKTLQGLAEASIDQLATVRGVGPAKAVQVKASLELARRLARPTSHRRRVVDGVEVADALIRPKLADKKQEHFVALLLNNRHGLIRLCPISIGSLSASLVHPRELFKEAIAASAAAIIIAHNHPSGDPEPSEHDLVLTKRLVQAGKLLGIEVLDHLIIGARCTTSLKACGVIS